MKRMMLYRTENVTDGTIGKLYVLDENGETLFSCDTLECPGPDSEEIGKRKRIPEGEYEVTYPVSPRFKTRLPLLSNSRVSSTRGILIHKGNYTKNTKGCILVGKRGKEENIVWSSGDTLQELLALLNYEPCSLVVINKGV